MKQLTRRSLRYAGVAVVALGAGLAQAHTGHGASTLYQGLTHPFGLDHLLAVLAVALWSASALPQKKAWWGPAAYLTALSLGAVLAAGGLAVPWMEQGVSLSVTVFGAMLALSALKSPARPSWGIGLVALGAFLHGLAHGAEAPAASFAGYAAGFFFTTAVLQAGALVAGLAFCRNRFGAARWITAALGSLLGGAGLYLFSQL
jgi:urease accessory protein